MTIVINRNLFKGNAQLALLPSTWDISDLPASCLET